jgi:hypothetical protein
LSLKPAQVGLLSSKSSHNTSVRHIFSKCCARHPQGYSTDS